MAGRTRTTKKLAQRINRDYFKNVYPIARWRRILSIVFAGLGILWLAWHAFARNESVYTSGPITSAHASFSLKCNACHAKQSVFSKAVTDQACTACHDGPMHNARQTFTPACAACHLEHQGTARLTHVSDQACTQCHSNLKTKDAHLTIASSVASFAHGHPEFRPLRNGQADPGTVKFNHKVHLASQLRGPTGNVQLKCVDCHRSSRTSAPAYIMPIVYSEACSSCHPLLFDKRLGDPAPHKDPAVVHAFVVKTLGDYIAKHPEALRATGEDAARIPRRAATPAPRTTTEWVNRSVGEAEQLLWAKTCKECHTLTFSDGSGVPQIAKADIPGRWLKHGNFDHSAHEMLVCTSCHSNALSSTRSSDLLIPGIQVCQQCHRPGERAAGSQCSECHGYHDWSKEQIKDGKFTLHELLSSWKSRAVKGSYSVAHAGGAFAGGPARTP